MNLLAEDRGENAVPSGLPDDLTLFVILDGFRHDYSDHAPFLREIADWSGRVRETFGFISTRPAMCAGVYPEETNLCFEYQLRPHGCTFRPGLFRGLGILAKVVPRRLVKLAASAWIRATSPAPVIRQTAFVGNLPFGRFPHFDYAETQIQTSPDYLPVPTIYDQIREARQRFLYLGFARPKGLCELCRRVYSVLVKGDLLETDRTLVKRFEGRLRRERPDFAHLHFSSPDWVGHKFGPNSSEMRANIREVDALLERVFHSARREYSTVRMLVTADHGMVPVSRHHDLDREALDGLEYSEPEDFLVFRDSTVARFWFFKPAAEAAVRERLVGVSWGTVLNQDARQKFRVRFPNNENGDLMFLLRPGEVLLPNYYQAAGAPPRGMHGYDPDVPENQGFIAIHDPAREISRVSGTLHDLVDIFPTLLDLHGLPAPEGLSGGTVLA